MVDAIFHNKKTTSPHSTIRLEIILPDEFLKTPKATQISQKTNNSSSLPMINTANLPTGQYHLIIRNFSDNPNSSIMDLSFDIPAKITNTWWFGPLLTFCLMLIPFSILYFFYLDKSRQTLRVETVRNQIASDLHDDVGANLSAIKNFTELLQFKLDKGKSIASLGLLNKVKMNLDETIERLQDTVWAINPLNDSIAELFEKMEDHSSSILACKGIELDYLNSHKPEDGIFLDMEQRYHLFLMYKEVINNVIKHSAASLVKVRVYVEEKTLMLKIQDNGKGFSPTEKSKGNGLRNLQSRSKNNFVALDIQSAPDQGTEINIKAYSM